MRPVGFEPMIPASERPQTYALDRAATGIGPDVYHTFIFTRKVRNDNDTDISRSPTQKEILQDRSYMN
jgi:hypothetical protein